MSQWPIQVVLVNWIKSGKLPPWIITQISLHPVAIPPPLLPQLWGLAEYLWYSQTAVLQLGIISNLEINK